MRITSSHIIDYELKIYNFMVIPKKIIIQLMIDLVMKKDQKIVRCKLLKKVIVLLN